MTLMTLIFLISQIELARSLALVNSWIAQICHADEECYILMRVLCPNVYVFAISKNLLYPCCDIRQTAICHLSVCSYSPYPKSAKFQLQ